MEVRNFLSELLLWRNGPSPQSVSKKRKACLFSETFLKAKNKSISLISLVFHKQGKRTLSIPKAWRWACQEAGLPGKISRDFRRTVVRNMVRAEIPERVAMQMAGHKTRSVFDRYPIVSDGDLQEAASGLENAFPGQTMTVARKLLAK